MTRVRQRWADSVDWPLTVAAVMFLAAYAVPILLRSRPARGLRLRAGDMGNVALFVVDSRARAPTTHVVSQVADVDWSKQALAVPDVGLMDAGWDAPVLIQRAILCGTPAPVSR